MQLQSNQLADMANTLRRDVLDMVHRAGTGHVGGSFSIAELISVLYFNVLNIDPEHPDNPERDHVVLSKGHAAPILYAALARRGFFPVKELATLRQAGSRLQGHPDSRKTPGVDLTSGCLGEGLSNGCGFAAAARIKGIMNHTYVILGDGELQEGQIWEAALFASVHKLDNLTAIVDCNGLMCDDAIDDILPMGDLSVRWCSFGWQVTEVDGHDVNALMDALRACRQSNGTPQVLLLHTVKGKGVSFMENVPSWHGAAVTDEIYVKAMQELGTEGRA